MHPSVNDWWNGYLKKQDSNHKRTNDMKNQHTLSHDLVKENMDYSYDGQTNL